MTKHLIKPLSVIMLHIVLGVGMLILSETLDWPGGPGGAVFLLIIFLFINLADRYIFKLKDELWAYWSLKKLHLLFIGVAGGAIIALLPPLIYILATGSSFSGVINYNSISLTAILTTLIIVSWEELWFRGIFLNYCRRYMSSLAISIIMGLLFMLIHVFNPDIDLLKEGAGLFFAGAMLTILYFYYKNIWLPIGLHFGNNYLGSFLKDYAPGNPLFGQEGYVGTAILAVIFVIYALRESKSSHFQVNASHKAESDRKSHS